MSEGRTKYPLSWLYLSEDIENVERVSLKLSTQRILGCVVGEHVFLEYPWAYVPRDVVKKLSSEAGSELEPHKDKIEKYQADTVLLGYASIDVDSCTFAICTTETARNAVRMRNGDITRKIKDKVSNMVRRTAGSWKSLGSEAEVNETFIRSLRPLFELEISLPASFLRGDRELSNRNADDVRDGYVEILPVFGTYENISTKQISRSSQTHLVGREVSVQTYPGYPKNAWTQYEYEHVLPESSEVEDAAENDEIRAVDEESSQVEERPEENGKENGEEVTEEAEESRARKLKPAEVFMEARSREMIELVEYNTAIDIHAEDVNELDGINCGNGSANLVEYEEYRSFVDLGITKGKVISDVSWHPGLTGIMAVCYVKASDYNVARRFVGKESDGELSSGSNATVLVWSFADSLYPKLSLESYWTVNSISFCPFRGDIIIGGCANGQIIIWDLNGYLTKEKMEGEQRFTTEILSNVELDDLKNVPVVSAAATSDKSNSHNSVIRKIQWISPYYRVERDGGLTKLAENLSLQFMTASQDGCIAIWDLCWTTASTSSFQDTKTTLKKGSSLSGKDLQSLDGTLKPIYRLFARVPKENANLHPLALYVPLPKIILQNVQDERSVESEFDLFAVGKSELKIERNSDEFLKQLWIGTLEGDLINCTWKGHEFSAEAASSENCLFLNRSYVHDGPVTNIVSSPYLRDVLLTVGGRVFAVWKSDYLQSPLLWRRCQYRYTACCWSGKPTVFLVARSDGVFETWDIRLNTNEPIFAQTVSGKCITGLFLYESSVRTDAIGICDYNGAFRVFGEPKNRAVDIDANIRWLENFISREVSRKREFAIWQDNYLRNDRLALDRKSARIAEEAKWKHEEAREKFKKEQEDKARLEVERKARQRPKSKSTIWKLADHERMQKILLEKKGFVPEKLEILRQPLVKRQEERKWKLEKAKRVVDVQEKYFKDAMSLQFPEYREETVSNIADNTVFEKTLDEVEEKDKQAFLQIREKARRILTENPCVPKFDWNAVMREGRLMRRVLDVEYTRKHRRKE